MKNSDFTGKLAVGPKALQDNNWNTWNVNG